MFPVSLNFLTRKEIIYKFFNEENSFGSPKWFVSTLFFKLKTDSLLKRILTLLISSVFYILLVNDLFFSNLLLEELYHHTWNYWLNQSMSGCWWFCISLSQYLWCSLSIWYSFFLCARIIFCYISTYFSYFICFVFYFQMFSIYLYIES